MSPAALTLAAAGLSPRPVEVAAEIVAGPCRFDLRGLPPAAARESRVRVRAALGQLGIDLADHALTVDLLPPDAGRPGGAFDLAIVVAILVAIGRVPADAVAGTAFLGELSLTGAIKPVRGVLPLLRGAAALGVTRAIVPGANGGEAAHVAGLDVREARHVGEVVAHLAGGESLAAPVALPFAASTSGASPVDLADLRGQPVARRAVEVAAAGGHSLLFVGPPGCGKTMAARRLASILPPMTEEEAIEVTAVHSVCGLVPSGGLVTSRPFRAPHHTLSTVALVGGGDPVRPGEVSLAHRGVLFLDELGEFRPSTLAGLREPMEAGEVTVSRAVQQVTFPAKPLLVAATNPCPCGFHGEHAKTCSCSAARVAAYQERIARPGLPLFDLRVRLRPLPLHDVGRAPTGEPSAVVQKRVIAARAVQGERLRRGESGAAINADLGPRDLARVVGLDTAGAGLMSAAVERLGLSARGYDRVLRVARTLADLDGRTPVLAVHVAEAIQMHLLPGGAS